MKHELHHWEIYRDSLPWVVTGFRSMIRDGADFKQSAMVVFSEVVRQQHQFDREDAENIAQACNGHLERVARVYRQRGY